MLPFLHAMADSNPNECNFEFQLALWDALEREGKHWREITIGRYMEIHDQCVLQLYANTDGDKNGDQ